MPKAGSVLNGGGVAGLWDLHSPAEFEVLCFQAEWPFIRDIFAVAL